MFRTQPEPKSDPYMAAAIVTPSPRICDGRSGKPTGRAWSLGRMKWRAGNSPGWLLTSWIKPKGSPPSEPLRIVRGQRKIPGSRRRRPKPDFGQAARTRRPNIAERRLPAPAKRAKKRARVRAVDHLRARCQSQCSSGVEQLFRKQQVMGSNPITGSSLFTLEG